MTITETFQQIKERLVFVRDTELDGVPIRAIEAAEKYNVKRQTLTRWVKRGFLRPLERGPKLLTLNEAEVKLVADIYNTAKQHTTHVKAGWILKKALQVINQA